MNKNGQFTFITYLVVVFIVVAFWAIGFSSFFSEQGTALVESSGATGIEAFFIANLNLVIFLALVLSVFAVIYFGG
jgi:hypothetical protein